MHIGFPGTVQVYTHFPSIIIKYYFLILISQFGYSLLSNYNAELRMLLSVKWEKQLDK